MNAGEKEKIMIEEVTEKIYASTELLRRSTEAAKKTRHIIEASLERIRRSRRALER